MTRRTAASTAFVAVLVLVACRKAEVPASAPSQPAIAAIRAPTVGPDAKRYALKGVVVKTDAARKRVTVEHEEIPGYMSAMTMDFPIRDDPKVIAFLRPGDRIEARLVVDGETYFLEEVLTKGFVPTPTRLRRRRRPARAQRGRRGRRRDPRLHADRPDRRARHALAVPRRAGRRHVRLHAVSDRDGLPADGGAVLEDRRGAEEGEVRRRFSAITVDPENDTPAVLKDYAARVGADPARWKFLTGDPAATSPAWPSGSAFSTTRTRRRSCTRRRSRSSIPTESSPRSTTASSGSPRRCSSDLQKARKG